MKPILLLLLSAVSLCAQSQFHDGLGLVGGPVSTLVPNDGGTGTTVNQLAKINVSGNAVITTTSDTAIPVFVVSGGAGTTGSAQLAVAGTVLCQTDAGGAAIMHFLVESTTIAGRCHDAGATAPTSGWVIGQAQTTAAASATTNVLLSQGYNAAAGGGGGGLPPQSQQSILTSNGTTASFGNLPTGPIGALDCATVPGQCDIVSAVVPTKSGANTLAGNLTLTGTALSVSSTATFTSPRVDMSGTAHASPQPVGLLAAIPATCTIGERYFATDRSPTGYACTALNTWTQDGGGSPGGGAPTFTNANSHIWTFMDSGQPFIYGALSNMGSFTSKLIYGFTVPAAFAGMVNYMQFLPRVGGTGGTGDTVGIYSCSATTCTNATLLKGANVVAASSQPQTVTISGGQALAAGSLYAFTFCTDDTSGLNLSTLLDGNANSSSWYNTNSNVRIFTAGSCTGSGGSLVMPSSLGTLTATTNVPFLVGQP